MADQQVVLNVSKDIIEAHVRATVATVLARDPEGLIRAMVDVAMNQKSPNGYSSETIWQATVNKMIRDVASETFTAWVEEMRPAIAKAVRERLNKKDRNVLLDKIVEKLTGALGRFNVRVDVSE